MGNNLFQYFAIKYYPYNSKYKIIILHLPSFNSPKPSIMSRLIRYFIQKISKRIDDSMLEDYNINLKLFNIFLGFGEIPKLFIGKQRLIRYEFNKKIFSRPKPNIFKNDCHHLVLHLRLGDRFLDKSNYKIGMFYDFKKLKKVITNIKKKNKNTKFYLVTDFKNLQDNLTFEKFEKLNFHVSVPKEQRIEFHKAKKYLEKIKNFIDDENFQIIQNTSLEEDFSYMYYSNTLIFLHGTLAWWAGFLGHQNQVFVSKEWRSIKTDDNRKIKMTKNIDPRWQVW